MLTKGRRLGRPHWMQTPYPWIQTPRMQTPWMQTLPPVDRRFWNITFPLPLRSVIRTWIFSVLPSNIPSIMARFDQQRHFRSHRGCACPFRLCSRSSRVIQYREVQSYDHTTKVSTPNSPYSTKGSFTPNRSENQKYQKQEMHSNRMRTACSLPYGGSSCQRPPLDRDLPPVDRQITLPQTSFAGGKKV